MCGIAGIFAREPIVKEKQLKAMTDALSHRGPDAEGQWVCGDNSLGIGHRRLSIIDTSDQGNQPMHYLNRYSIVFNGEIYNYIELRNELLKKGYHFQSKTDTEVLLALYDLKREKLLNDLDGMFAFSIWDQQERTLFCARDRFGEKPFYYAFDPENSFAFASEMKALFAAGISRILNNRMIYNYLNEKWQNNPHDNSETFFKNIFKLEPAHFLLLKEGKIVKKERYWQLHPHLQIKISLTEAMEQFRDLFSESVKKRLRSDVPVGSSLSGGLDSSTIVSLIHSLNPSVQHTFSASFPGYAKDETHYMKMVAERSNAISHYTIPNADDLANELDSLFYHQEEPFGSASIFAQWKVMQLAKENSTIVLLDGQGADELLAGYTFYYRTFFQELFAKNYSTFKAEYAAYKKWGGNHFNYDLTFKLQALLPSLYNFYLKLKPYAANPGDVHPDFYNQYKAESFTNTAFTPSLNNHLSNTLLVTGFEDLLRYADRNSMAFSREIRLPYLDHKLVEFAYSLPSTYKIHDGWTKYLLRKSFEPILPKEVAWRKDKIGYAPPESEWLQSKQLKDIVENAVSILDREKIINRRRISNDKLWSYIMISKLF